MRPYDVTDSEQLVPMESDNWSPDSGSVWILHNGDHISIPVTNGGWIEIPRDEFNSIVDWYMKDQPAPATEEQPA